MSGVRGQAELRRVARLIRQQIPAEMRRKMSANIRKPVKPFEARVKAEIPGSVPARYAGVLAPATKAKILGGFGGGLGYTIEVYAKGHSEDRDVAAVNDGVLRHKTFGRAHTKTGKSLWFAQHVRGGFVDRALDQLGDQLAKEIEQAVEEVARTIEGG